ncbi:FtsK/SpoIIIE domain-containing protein [Actinotalea sp. AC32]|nr:FtsK/SpoIIIE domain-containing protein [Actinotalea sp. AC32]
MRLYLSAARSPDGDLVDLAVDCDEDATVGDVALRLERELGGPRASGGVGTGAAAPRGLVRDTGRRLGVVVDAPDEPAGSAAPSAGPRPGAPTTGRGSTTDVLVGDPPELVVGSRVLDPTQPVASSPLRNGAVVGVGGPLDVSLAEPSGVVELRVVSGPGAGAVRRLGPGRHRVGPEPASSLRTAAGPRVELEVRPDGAVTVRPLDDDADDADPPVRVSPLTGPIVVPRRGDAGVPSETRGRRRRRRAPEPSAMPDHVTVDPDEPRAPVELDRTRLTGTEAWEPGVPLTVGECVLEHGVPRPPDASLSPSPGGATMDYNRPPRLLPAPRLTEFVLPKEPAAPARQPIPVLVMIAPMVMGLGMFLVTQRLYTLIFIALSPLLMLANWWHGRRTQRSRHVEQAAEYAAKRARVEQAAFEALMVERRARRDEAPDPAEVLLQATGPRARLWERRTTDPDWLLVRVGTADLPSEVVLTDPARDKHQGALTWTAPDVPVTVRLAEAGVTGVAGRDGLAQRVASWVVAQVAALHSPADVRLAVLTHGGEAATWSWVRWLPHLRAGEGSGPLAVVGTDAETTARRVADLAAVLDARREAASGGRGVAFEPLLVVLDGARALRLLPGMVPLLREGPAHQMYFLCLDDDVTLLPEECRAVVSRAHGALRVQHTGRPTVDAVRADLVEPAWLERLARALAPVHDVSSVAEASTVPNQSRLLSVLRLDPPTPERVAAGWSAGGRTTTAVIGEGADGPFSIDLRTDGPHGLVAGTTGSGKSELLQTIIASLAVGNRPDEMTFVLVDYKGGAAFKDCAHLPHTVGMVTDLDGHLTTRALESLGAELRRREHQLADAGAKDIEDYLAGRGPGDPPMPRLLIVIDEFAALVAELPDFVTGLVDIARRGRSLGVHLILATQRPAGVVSAEIKSNTNLRIALRVTDPGDSQDVVESDVAAHIAPSNPGRAYARLGHSQLMLFQSARVGGRPRAEGGTATVAARVLDWSTLGTAAPAPVARADDDVSTPTDLALLVRAVTGATGSVGVERSPSPWLPALPEVVVLADHLVVTEPVVGVVPPVPLGLGDLPALQRQETLTWDLAGGSHLAVAGQSRSGRSSALRLVAAGIAAQTSPRDVHVYGIDCGNGALLPLVAMPHVGAVVTRDQPDRVRRLLAMLGAEVARRQQLLAAGAFADVGEQRAAAAPDDRLPYVVLALDRWEGFVAAFEQSDGGQMLDQLLTLLREGQAVGLRAVLTGDRTMLVGRMGAALEDRLLLRMPSPDDYSYVGMRQKDVPTRMPAGRAFRSGEHATEVQLALLADDASGTAQVAALQRLAAEATERAGRLPRSLRPRRVDELPVVLDWAQAVALREEPAARTELLVGVGGDTLGVRSLDVDVDGPGFLVVGPQRSGRSTALLATARDALARGWKVAVVAPRRSPLRELASTGGRAVTAVLTADDAPDALRAALDVRGPRLLVVDDFEVLGGEHPLSAVAEEYYRGIRDTGDALAVACGVDEVTGMYRGVTATLRKARTGLLLAPRSSADGDVFTARLPRSVGGAVPQGRGILVRAGSWEWVQVPMTAPAD